MARARKVPDLDCDGPFARAAARVVEVRGAEVFAHAPGIFDVSEIEHVHDMRVATRRLRAAMEIFAPCFPPKRHRAVLKQVKALADALGERRDRDVAIGSLEGFAAALRPSDRRGVRTLIDRLRDEQERANEELWGVANEARLEDLARGLAELVAAARETIPPPARSTLVPGASGQGAG
jgi:CHAD domain-containing protein